MTLDGAGLGEYIYGRFRERGDRLYRLELLPRYAPNAGTLARWRAGETEPDWGSPWSKTLAEQVERGLVQQRVRVLTADLDDDERSSCLLGYPPNARYEEIRILRHSEHTIPDLPDVDHWLMRPRTGGVHAVLMRYDAAGTFLGGDVETDEARLAALAAAADRAWDHAEPFEAWRRRHLAELRHRQVS